MLRRLETEKKREGRGHVIGEGDSDTVVAQKRGLAL